MLTSNYLAMKTNKLFLLLGFLAILPFTGCSPENDIKNPQAQPFSLYEAFSGNTVDGNVINLAGWNNYAETGTVKWKEGIYYSDKYAEFTAYQSTQASNIGWLISPALNMDLASNEKLAFDVAQAYVSSASNSIELLISTDYDGTNVLTAHWESKTFTKPPLNYDTNFDFFSSGIVDLSTYTGNIYIAFKVKGSGTNTSLDGTYEIDNVRIFNQK
jgi:hypothetical protein